MRVIASMCVVLAATCLSGGQTREYSSSQTRSTDLYGYGSVTSAFEECRRGGPYFSSFFNGIPLLGDQVSIAVVKQWDADELAAPENIRAYLYLVRIAFKYPDKILNRENRNANVTLLLLSYLRIKESRDVGLEKEIESTRTYVEGQISKSVPPGDASE